MKHRPILRLVSWALITSASAGLASSARAQNDECRQLANDLLTNSGITQKILLETNFAGLTDSVVCAVQANANNRKIAEAVAPQRTAVWNAFNNLSGSEQQGASSSAGASTNAVSKPSGPSALAEEFGGANVSTGTSSFTAQWAPGSMFTNLALTGVDYLCLSPGNPKGCISPKLLKRLTPLTLKITANTSGASSSATGTASATAASGKAQPVTVTSKGASGPGFAGVTAQYSFWGSRKQAGVTSLTTTSISSPVATYYVNEMNKAAAFTNALAGCDVYTQWQKGATAAVVETLSGVPVKPGKDDIQRTQNAIEEQFRMLVTDMLASKACTASIQGLQQFMAAILEAQTYEEFTAMEHSTAAPELALEYDLNTPQNQPSYSSAKFTGNWQFGKTVPKKGAAPAKASTAASGNPCNAGAKPAALCQIAQFAQSQAAAVSTVAGASAAKNPEAQAASAASARMAAAAAKPLANANAQPGSLTVTGGAAVYHSEPSSSIPSASHLRDLQAAAEFSWLFAPNPNSSVVRTFIGPITAAAAYSYQDQISPAILTGPALADFTGLPASTTTAYTKRGVIHLEQFRLGFGKGSNTSFPLCFTRSNRTELITHPTWGVQFGVSYNLTSLFTSSGTSKSGAATPGS